VDSGRQEIYQKILQHISEGYAVAYVGEGDEAGVIQHFQDMGVPIQEYIDKGLLTIVNRDLFYSPFVPSKVLLEQWNKLFANIERKAGKGCFKGFVAVGMPADSFFISEADNQQLVRYESLAAKNYKGKFEAACFYTTEKIQQMPLRHIISLLNAHQNTGHRNWALKVWNPQRGLAIIKRGLDSALGPNTAELIIPILIRDFDMNLEALILLPDQLERKLEILFGPTALGVVTEHIKSELCKDIAF
jgi:hypothetical protein